MKGYTYVNLRQRPDLAERAAAWFHDKWTVDKQAYLTSINAYITCETEYGWYLCLDENTIVAGLGVIDNDFHKRYDLFPNVCAVYVESKYRCQGIAGRLLNNVVDDLKSNGISPVYLITDHRHFYERYGWEFIGMVEQEDEPAMIRMYVHY